VRWHRPRPSPTGHVVECPLHLATFDVRTGKLLSGPAAADVPTYEVRVEGDTVYVKR
jgi:nitrite reductase/ring-hydroxylating ferredoxin subunit